MLSDANRARIQALVSGWEFSKYEKVHFKPTPYGCGEQGQDIHSMRRKLLSAPIHTFTDGLNKAIRHYDLRGRETYTVFIPPISIDEQDGLFRSDHWLSIDISPDFVPSDIFSDEYPEDAIIEVRGLRMPDSVREPTPAEEEECYLDGSIDLENSGYVFIGVDAFHLFIDLLTAKLDSCTTENPAGGACVCSSNPPGGEVAGVRGNPV